MTAFKKTTIASLIEMFNVCPSVSEFTDEKIRTVAMKGLKKGFAIHPACVNVYSEHFLDNREMQYNSTFYKTWSDVTNKSRFELFIDQVFHYFTMNADVQYVPNTDPSEPEWYTYKVIMPCTFEELYNKCFGMLKAGAALKSDTVEVLTDYIITYSKSFGVVVDVDSIRNREALVIICDALGVLPKDGAKLFAHIVYKATGLTMLVKNRETRKRIQSQILANTSKALQINKMWYSLNDSQLIALASVFNRYKELFLAFKGNSTTNRVINRITRLSKKYHRPMKRGFWETILLAESYNPTQVAQEAEKATNFKLIQVMQSVRERLLLAAGMGDNLYVIRNGKVFVKDNNYNAVDSRYFNWEEIYQICEDQLIRNLSEKACTVKFPEKYDLVCPTSEKNFIGDIPMGSSCKLDNDAVFGIYWTEDWGTRDFDLSFNDIHGNRIGWNAGYGELGTSGIVYSGDITRAPHGANEVMYVKKDCPDGILYVNRYNGNANSKFRMFFGVKGNRPVSDFTKPMLEGSYCMVNPNDITLETMVSQGEMSEMMVGCIFDNKMHFINLSCGYGRVAQALRVYHNKSAKGYAVEREMTANSMTEMLKRKAYSTINLKEILLKAGFVEGTKAKDENDTYIDLTLLDRGTLIELFSKE